MLVRIKLLKKDHLPCGRPLSKKYKGKRGGRQKLSRGEVPPQNIINDGGKRSFRRSE